MDWLNLFNLDDHSIMWLMWMYKNHHLLQFLFLFHSIQLTIVSTAESHERNKKIEEKYLKNLHSFEITMECLSSFCQIDDCIKFISMTNVELYETIPNEQRKKTFFFVDEMKLLPGMIRYIICDWRSSWISCSSRTSCHQIFCKIKWKQQQQQCY